MLEGVLYDLSVRRGVIFKKEVLNNISPSSASFVFWERIFSDSLLFGNLKKVKKRLKEEKYRRDFFSFFFF